MYICLVLFLVFQVDGSSRKVNPAMDKSGLMKEFMSLLENLDIITIKALVLLQILLATWC